MQNAPDLMMLATVDWPFLVFAVLFAAFVLSWRPYLRLARECDAAWSRDGDAARSVEWSLRLRRSWLPLALLTRWVRRGWIEGLIAARLADIGELDEALSWSEQGLRIARKPEIKALLRTVAAFCHAARGNREAFAQHLAALAAFAEKQAVPATSYLRTAIYGELVMGYPDRAEALAHALTEQSPQGPPPECFGEVLAALTAHGRFLDVLRLTSGLLPDAGAPDNQAPPPSPPPSPTDLTGQHVREVYRRAIETAPVLLALTASRHLERWDLYEQYLHILDQLPSPLPHLRLERIGREAIWAAHCGDHRQVGLCAAAAEAIVAQYPRDHRANNVRCELMAEAWQILGEHQHALGELALVSTDSAPSLNRSEHAATAARSLEALELTDAAETKRAEARALAPAAYWNRPPGTEPPSADEPDDLVNAWLNAGPRVAIEGAMAVAGIGPVAPAASGAAAAAWVLSVLAMVPIVGMLAAIPLVPVSIVLLAKRKPLLHDRRTGAAALAFACLSFVFGATAILGFTQRATQATYTPRPLHHFAPTTTRAAATQEFKADGQAAASHVAPKRSRSWFQDAIIFAVLIISIMLHEIGHAVAAFWGGDPTARDLRRFSLNPLRHIDIFGSIILPILLVVVRSDCLIGWAKPVLVRFDRLRHPRRGQLGVTLAGVSLNLLIAFLATNLLVVITFTIFWLYPDAVVFRLVMPLTPSIVVNAGAPALWQAAIDVCKTALIINALLAGFNLLPIPPLDGFGVIRALAPKRLSGLLAKAAGTGMILLFVLIALNVLQPLLRPTIYLAATLLAYAGIVTGAW